MIEQQVIYLISSNVMCSVILDVTTGEVEGTQWLASMEASDIGCLCAFVSPSLQTHVHICTMPARICRCWNSCKSGIVCMAESKTIVPLDAYVDHSYPRLSTGEAKKSPC